MTRRPNGALSEAVVRAARERSEQEREPQHRTARLSQPIVLAEVQQEDPAP